MEIVHVHYGLSVRVCCFCFSIKICHATNHNRWWVASSHTQQTTSLRAETAALAALWMPYTAVTQLLQFGVAQKHHRQRCHQSLASVARWLTATRMPFNVSMGRRGIRRLVCWTWVMRGHAGPTSVRAGGHSEQAHDDRVRGPSLQPGRCITRGCCPPAAS